MENPENRAINAIWKTELENPEEKLVLYQLAAKHELGERYSSSWKSVDQFLKDYEERWCQFKELKEATQMSEIKLQRTVSALKKRNFIVTDEIPVKLNKSGDNKGETQTVYAITPKIFEDFASGLSKEVANA